MEKAAAMVSMGSRMQIVGRKGGGDGNGHRAGKSSEGGSTDRVGEVNGIGRGKSGGAG